MGRFLFTTIILSLLLGCNPKTTTTPEYFIKAKFNGELKEFKKLVTGQKGLDNGKLVHLTWGASQTEGSSFPSYDFDLWKLGGEIINGNYSEANTTIMSRYAIDGFTRHNNINNSLQDYEITITSLANDNFSGTFKGTITNSAGANIIISEGEFFCPLKD